MACLFLANSFWGGCSAKEFDMRNGVTVEADEILIRKNESLMVFSGNIRMRSEKLKILVRKTLTLHYTDLDGRINPTSMDMIDLVAVNDRGTRISGDRGDYDFVNSILTVRDNVIVNEKNSVIFVDRAVYDSVTEEINMSGNRSLNNDREKKVIIIMDGINSGE
ncbi:MAG: hypothetical protein LBB24_00075 [Rickettsiales bacterium]|nr:hypothetical protein [Rickettsiales bacterium]